MSHLVEGSTQNGVPSQQQVYHQASANEALTMSDIQVTDIEENKVYC